MLFSRKIAENSAEKKELTKAEQDQYKGGSCNPSCSDPGCPGGGHSYYEYEGPGGVCLQLVCDVTA